LTHAVILFASSALNVWNALLKNWRSVTYPLCREVVKETVEVGALQLLDKALMLANRIASDIVSDQEKFSTRMNLLHY
jgi:hypothetical protein